MAGADPASHRRVFLDANILFAAACSPGGVTRALVDLAGDSGCVLLTSPQGELEARRNLTAKRPDAVAELGRLLRRISITPAPPREMVRAAVELGLPLDDAEILAGAVAARADCLVTGDKKHFGRYMNRPALTLGGRVVERLQALTFLFPS